MTRVDDLAIYLGLQDLKVALVEVGFSQLADRLVKGRLKRRSGSHAVDWQDLTIDYPPGTTQEVTMPDGSHIVLKKLAEDYDARNQAGALMALQEAKREQKLLTGLLYVNPEARAFEEELSLVEAPLASLTLETVRPPKAVLDEIMTSYRVGTVAAAAGGG